jgi:hypothetical protein
LYIALLCYIIGSAGVFFQHNLQFINDWWKDKTVLNVFIFSIPIGFLYLRAWTYFVTELGSVWSARFLFFGLSYLVFPILAYVFLNETPWSLKTILCTFLSVVIILIQYKL